VPAAAVDVQFSARLIAWQHQHGRHTLPWQHTQDPYRVWLSEIMLQQTQVVTVLGYFERFLVQFPCVEDLAAAGQDTVLALWSGLGYYSRARNLHACAKAVVTQYGGIFPRSSSVLQTLPGIGRSTAAAIAAFCFGERVAILDANVKRVLSRYLAFDADLSVVANERILWQRATDLLPVADGITAYTQGLMDLGATVCMARAAQCPLCPVQHLCAGKRTGQPERFPFKSRKLKRSQRGFVWLLLLFGNHLWLTQRPNHGVWAGLWSLPELDSLDSVAKAGIHWPGEMHVLPTFKHVLTHLDLRMQPVVWTLNKPGLALPSGVKNKDGTLAHPFPQVAQGITDQPGQWVTVAQALQMGLPAPLRRLLATQASLCPANIAPPS
jgi:A/G-specific adenine glycosylase